MANAEQDNSAPSMRMMTPSVICQDWQRLVWVFLFGCAMGLLEAICVIYLRGLIIPAGVDAGYPVAPLQGLSVEHIREACTMIMLLAAAWLAGFNWLSPVAYFFFIFGVWDIAYYVGLKWLAHWPSSWLEWDCLFLIPKPWYGPVLAPILISAYFVLACCLLLTRKSFKAKLRLSAPSVSLQLLALLLWSWSFVKDSDRIAAHGYEGVSYSWLLFASALASGLLGLWLAMRAPRAPSILTPFLPGLKK